MMDFGRMVQYHVWGVLAARTPAKGEWVDVARTCQICHRTYDLRQVMVHPLDVSDEFRAKAASELLTIVPSPYQRRGQVFLVGDTVSTAYCSGPPARLSKEMHP